ncbi:hypothetical protein JYB87_00385 [Shewanella avicenniae]|uniref:Transcriptional regulator VspR n=1 Tax=Shewanella avicenniae TaxID=2814294 RepID=A0ABX7QS46_9GAMM|nr:hypothetical protein [Shewanella avicenniae]QSX33750.1 hypothetical protein JYB87_00385 [Shewanella avicenniae]
MKRPKKISAIMHKLLVEERMDAFSVIEARNALLALGWKSSNADNLRKQIYRQLLSFLNNDWLRTEGIGREKRYHVTDTFMRLKNVGKTDVNYPVTTKAKADKNDYSILVVERCKYEGELKIVLGEIDEYRALLVRFPSLEKHITPLLDESKIRSAELLGKVNVLSNVLKSLSAENSAC